MRYGRGGGGEEELAKVLLVEGHGVSGRVAVVGAAAELGTDGDLGGEPDDGDADAVREEVGDGIVDIARIAGEECAVDDEDLAGAVRRGVAKVRWVLDLRFLWGR